MRVDVAARAIAGVMAAAALLAVCGPSVPLFNRDAPGVSAADLRRARRARPSRSADGAGRPRGAARAAASTAALPVPRRRPWWTNRTTWWCAPCRPDRGTRPRLRRTKTQKNADPATHGRFSFFFTAPRDGASWSPSVHRQLGQRHRSAVAGARARLPPAAGDTIPAATVPTNASERRRSDHRGGSTAAAPVDATAAQRWQALLVATLHFGRRLGTWPPSSPTGMFMASAPASPRPNLAHRCSSAPTTLPAGRALSAPGRRLAARAAAPPPAAKPLTTPPTLPLGSTPPLSPVPHGGAAAGLRSRLVPAARLAGAAAARLRPPST